MPCPCWPLWPTSVLNGCLVPSPCRLQARPPMQRHDGCAEHADRQLVLAARLQYTDNLMRPRRSECSHSATHRQRFSRHSAAQPSTAKQSTSQRSPASPIQHTTAPPSPTLPRPPTSSSVSNIPICMTLLRCVNCARKRPVGILRSGSQAGPGQGGGHGGYGLAPGSRQGGMAGRQAGRQAKCG